MSQKFYGQAIDTSDAKPYVVAEVEFETYAEAHAFALGVSKAAKCIDYDEMHGTVSDAPAKDE